MPTWTNWARNQRCTPAELIGPRTEADVARAVVAAPRKGRRVKAVGAGHSFTDTACTNGTLVSLAGLDRIDIDTERQQVRVGAGVSLHTLNLSLHRAGLALPNLGDIDVQSVAGATSTATHGTGLELPNLSAGITGFRLATATGDIVEATPDSSDPMEVELWRVGRVGLGALGVLTELTLDCVPAFNLHAIEEPIDVDELVVDLDAEFSTNRHFEFFWLPHTTSAQVKRNNPTDGPSTFDPRAAWLKEDVFENRIFGAINRIGRRFPERVPQLARLMASKSSRSEYIAPSHAVFASVRRVRFVEMEYAVPYEHLVEAFGRVRDLIDRLGAPISFPIEVRAVAADDIPLSTASGRATGYIAVHVFERTPYDAYFRGVEQIMDDYDGRPHWGKMHFQAAATLAERYPEWDSFQKIRDRLDPERVFGNAYLDRVLA